jgi:hypothetical protein
MCVCLNLFAWVFNVSLFVWAVCHSLLVYLHLPLCVIQNDRHSVSLSPCVCVNVPCVLLWVCGIISVLFYLCTYIYISMCVYILTVCLAVLSYILVCYLLIYEVYWKVPGLGQKRNAGLTYSILAAISFKIVSLRTYTVIPSLFPCFKSTVEVIFLNVVKYCLWFPLDVRQFQNIVP